MHILSAKWVIPIEGEVIANGAVVVEQGRIVDLGARQKIAEKYNGLFERSVPGILMPGLVNCHTHLELTPYGQIPTFSEKNSFTGWIERLIEKRVVSDIDSEEVVDAIQAEVDHQVADGTTLIGDIANQKYAEFATIEQKYSVKIVNMLEIIGASNDSAAEAQMCLQGLDEHTYATAHAPYSTGPELIKNLKNRCKKYSHPFSVHTSESASEHEFLQSASGQFRDFLEKRVTWDGYMDLQHFGVKSSIEYFDELGILDGQTLLVHCVHFSEEDLERVVKSGAHICVCMGSNEFLKVGVVPVDKMVSKGLVPALGTDSICSNNSLNLWREMQLIARSFTGIEPATILEMVTLAGARGLLQEKDYGSLQVGKKARILHVDSSSLQQCTTAGELLEQLVTGGRPKYLGWC